jgi:hypothetical protein
VSGVSPNIPPPVPTEVTRRQQWPTTTPISLHAWMCDCGAHGLTDCQPASRRELETHLAGLGHGRGEYYYGSQDQRTTVAVTADPDGRFTHQLR